MCYPQLYKTLLEALRNTESSSSVSIQNLVLLFPEIRKEVEANRHLAEVQNEDTDVESMDYEDVRGIIEKTILHHGYIEIENEVYDSVDDCADILIDLDEIEKLEKVAGAKDVWWQYIFSYDHHFGEHMKNLEKQAETLNSKK